jgi:hypothetical protein
MREEAKRSMPYPQNDKSEHQPFGEERGSESAAKPGEYRPLAMASGRSQDLLDISVDGELRKADSAVQFSPRTGFSPLTFVRAVQRFAFAGNPEVIKEQIDALRALGLDEIIPQFPGTPLCLARGSHLRSNAPRSHLAPAGMS